MDHGVSKAIRSFIANDPPPMIQDLLDRDAPDYVWTTALVEALVGQTLVARDDQTTGATQFVSHDGTSVLAITTTASGARLVEGLLADDLRDLLGAIRIHEVESYDLVMLPPDMRKADLDYLCAKAGLTSDRLRRFTDLWISQK